MRVPYDEMKATVKAALINHGVSEEKAEVCATVHTQNSCDGVYSHGLGRVAEFCRHADAGYVKLNASPTLENAFGAMEVYNGNMGIGICNALFATDRAIALAEQNGVGLVGLHNTAHWMRGGYYGLYASRKGYAALLTTNSGSFMPPWGGVDKRLGNNPFVMSMPTEGEPVILDLAVSQYSGGKLNVTKQTGGQLPYPGGFDENGRLSTDPQALQSSGRMLPIGYWKGATFSFMLDMFASCLANGSSTRDLDEAEKTVGRGNACSQLYIVIDPKRACSGEHMLQQIQKAKDYIKSSRPDESGAAVIYPGEDFERARAQNLREGILVIPEVWAEVKGLAQGKSEGSRA